MHALHTLTYTLMHTMYFYIRMYMYLRQYFVLLVYNDVAFVESNCRFIWYLMKSVITTSWYICLCVSISLLYCQRTLRAHLQLYILGEATSKGDLSVCPLYIHPSIHPSIHLPLYLTIYTCISILSPTFEKYVC